MCLASGTGHDKQGQGTETGILDGIGCQNVPFFSFSGGLEIILGERLSVENPALFSKSITAGLLTNSASSGGDSNLCPCDTHRILLTSATYTTLNIGDKR